MGTLEPTSSPALLVILFWEEEEKEEEEEEDETDESKAVDVLWVPVQLLFMTSFTILPLFGVWVLPDESWIIGFLGDDFYDVSVFYAQLGRWTRF